jgi:hypothetical protein
LGENLSRSGMKLFTPSLLSALILCIEKMHDIYNNSSSITMIIEYEYNYVIITIVERIIKAALNTLALKIDVQIPFGNDE